MLLAHLVFASAYAGFQWTVRLLVYPQFALVQAVGFPAYERSHQRRISLVVGPLFGAMALTTAGLLFLSPAGVPWWGAAGAAALLASILAVTAFLAVPLHGRLATGWDPGAFRSLLRVDLVRALIASVNVLLAAWLAG